MPIGKATIRAAAMSGQSAIGIRLGTIRPTTILGTIVGTIRGTTTAGIGAIPGTTAIIPMDGATTDVAITAAITATTILVTTIQAVG